MARPLLLTALLILVTENWLFFSLVPSEVSRERFLSLGLDLWCEAATEGSRNAAPGSSQPWKFGMGAGPRRSGLWLLFLTRGSVPPPHPFICPLLFSGQLQSEELADCLSKGNYGGMLTGYPERRLRLFTLDPNRGKVDHRVTDVLGSLGSSFCSFFCSSSCSSCLLFHRPH